MNRIIFFTFLGTIICQSAFAARVKYNIVTGEIISMAQTKDNKVGANEAILDVNSDVITDIQNYKVDQDIVRPKTAAELAQDQTAKNQEKADRKTRKKSIMTKLGLNKQELKSLLELIQDGSDD